jgi:hypothetical protein
MRHRTGILCTVLCLLSTAASAQPAATRSQSAPNDGPRTFNVQRMSFDMWCQDTQRYAIERCTARQADDLKAFEEYRATVERYEIEFLRQQEQERSAQERVNRDPTDINRTLQDRPAR